MELTQPAFLKFSSKHEWIRHDHTCLLQIPSSQESGNAIGSLFSPNHLTTKDSEGIRSARIRMTLFFRVFEFPHGVPFEIPRELIPLSPASRFIVAAARAQRWTLQCGVGCVLSWQLMNSQECVQHACIYGALRAKIRFVSLLSVSRDLFSKHILRSLFKHSPERPSPGGLARDEGLDRTASISRVKPGYVNLDSSSSPITVLRPR